MGFKSFMKKFATHAAQVAPVALLALGLPPTLATPIVGGITAALAMPGASNEQKAALAAQLAREAIAATNGALAAGGHGPLVDETVSDDVLAQAIKITYDMTKVLHKSVAGPMLEPAPAL